MELIDSQFAHSRELSSSTQRTSGTPKMKPSCRNQNNHGGN